MQERGCLLRHLLISGCESENHECQHAHGGRVEEIGRTDDRRELEEEARHGGHGLQGHIRSRTRVLVEAKEILHLRLEEIGERKQ